VSRRLGRARHDDAERLLGEIERLTKLAQSARLVDVVFAALQGEAVVATLDQSSRQAVDALRSQLEKDVQDAEGTLKKRKEGSLRVGAIAYGVSIILLISLVSIPMLGKPVKGWDDALGVLFLAAFAPLSVIFAVFVNDLRQFFFPLFIALVSAIAIAVTTTYISLRPARVSVDERRRILRMERENLH
jgi:hypothetical protein